MLAAQPNERPQSARELSLAIERCRRALVAARHRPRWLAAAALFCLLLFAGSFALTKHFSRAKALQAEKPPLEKSILPFDNLSDDKHDASFAAGVQDEVLSDLARIADLKVISRTSVMQYAGGGARRNVREISRSLGVANLLEGTVQRSGNRVRVTAQLIDARNDRHLWAEHYDRFVEQVKTKNPASTKLFDSQLARFKFAEGDLTSALALSRNPADEKGLDMQFHAAFFARDYSAAIRTIAAAPPDLVQETFGDKSPGCEAEAQVFRARGEHEKAKRIFRALREGMDKHSTPTARNEWYYAFCGEFDAGLGRKEEAIREARQAVDMHSIAQDPINGTDIALYLAKAYAWTGGARPCDRAARDACSNPVGC